MGTCAFCTLIEAGDTEWSNDDAVAFRDRFPISPGHALVVPRLHEPNLFELGAPVRAALWALVDVVQRDLSVVACSRRFQHRRQRRPGRWPDRRPRAHPRDSPLHRRRRRPARWCPLGRPRVGPRTGKPGNSCRPDLYDFAAQRRYASRSSRSRYAWSVGLSKQTKRTVATAVGVERTVSTAMSVAASSG